MFNIVTMKDTIRIDPSRMGYPLKESAFEELRNKFEGLVDEELGYVISVKNLEINASSIARSWNSSSAIFYLLIHTLKLFKY